MEESDDHSESCAVEPVDGPKPDVDAVEEVVVYLAEGRALVIGSATEERSRWGRWLESRPSAAEFRTLVAQLDQATRAYVESQAWIGRYVELDPLSRAMWGDGFKTFTDENGWSQANLRNEETSKYARLMRVRRLDGIGNIATVTAVLGAMAAQAETAEITETLNLISNRVGEISQHQRTDQVGAVENAVEQVAGLILRLREHGLDGVHESDFTTIRNSLGDARRKVLGHLRDEVGSLEKLAGISPVDVDRALGDDGEASASIYIGLLGQVHLATLQLELGQVAAYLLQGKAGIAETWITHITEQVERFDGELEHEGNRIDALGASIRGQFQPAWRHIFGPGEKVKEASLATGAVFAAAAKKLAGDRTLKLGGVAVPGPALTAGAGMLGAAVGQGSARARSAIVQPRAQRRVEARLQELEDGKEFSFSRIRQARPSLELLSSVAGEISGASDVFNLPD